MEKAIKLAISGGWKYPADYEDEALELATRYWQDTCLDPLFWQALGKALKWKKEPCQCDECGVIGVGEWNHLGECKRKNRPGSWESNWHRFIDHLIAGKDAESFFKSLTEQES